MILLLDSIEIDCIIGERPDERTRLQRLRVDLEIATDDRAAETDELDDAVDYVALADAVRARLVEAKCKLIERAAALCVETALSFRGVASAKARVEKAGAIPGLRAATAVFSARRDSAGERAQARSRGATPAKR